MELGEHPREFLLQVDQMTRELERVERPVDPKDVDIVILKGLSSRGLNVGELFGLAHPGVDRLQSEQSAAESKTMLAGHGNGRNSTPAVLNGLAQV